MIKKKKKRKKKDFLSRGYYLFAPFFNVFEQNMSVSINTLSVNKRTARDFLVMEDRHGVCLNLYK